MQTIATLPPTWRELLPLPYPREIEPGSAVLCPAQADSGGGGIPAPSGQTDQETSSWLREFRDSLASNGPVCPRCSSHYVVRYGRPKGIQKYKCKGCGRYFNEFTGTLFHRTRHLGKWLEYMALLLEGQCLRDIGRLLRMSKNTAFDWRHKVISRLAAMDRRTKLKGIIEVNQLLYGKCHKGSRDKRGRCTHGGYSRWFGGLLLMAPAWERAYVVFALDRTENVVGTVIPGESSQGVDEVLMDQIVPGSHVCVKRSIGHWPVIQKSWLPLTWVTDSRNRIRKGDITSTDPAHHVENVRGSVSCVPGVATQVQWGCDEVPHTVHIIVLADDIEYRS